MIRRNTLVFSTLTTMARQRLGVDEPRCAAALQLLDTCVELDSALHHQLGKSGLSEAKFGVLLTLFTLDPNPVCPADLAYYAGFTRSSITDAVHELQIQGHVAVERASSDRRSVDVRLTETGRTTVEEAVARYLTSLGSVVTELAAESPAALRRLAANFANGTRLLTP